MGKNEEPIYLTPGAMKILAVQMPGEFLKTIAVSYFRELNPNLDNNLETFSFPQNHHF